MSSQTKPGQPCSDYFGRRVVIHCSTVRMKEFGENFHVEFLPSERSCKYVTGKKASMIYQERQGTQELILDGDMKGMGPCPAAFPTQVSSAFRNAMVTDQESTGVQPLHSASFWAAENVHINPSHLLTLPQHHHTPRQLLTVTVARDWLNQEMSGV